MNMKHIQGCPESAQTSQPKYVYCTCGVIYRTLRRSKTAGTVISVKKSGGHYGYCTRINEIMTEYIEKVDVTPLPVPITSFVTWLSGGYVNSSIAL